MKKYHCKYKGEFMKYYIARFWNIPDVASTEISMVLSVIFLGK